jgi:hypothetical protein
MILLRFSSFGASTASGAETDCYHRMSMRQALTADVGERRDSQQGVALAGAQ